MLTIIYSQAILKLKKLKTKEKAHGIAQRRCNMGKSKVKAVAELMDGGFVPRQFTLIIENRNTARRREVREVEFARRREKQDRLMAEHRAKENERLAADAERLKAHNEKLRQKQEEYNKPLPEFAPRIPQEVRGKFFEYVARVVSDALWNLEYPEYRDDPFGYEQENAAILGEEIPPPRVKPPRKKVPAECLQAALRISKLAPFDKSETRIRLRATISIFIDDRQPCFTTEDRTRLGSHHFDKRFSYRIQKNLGKNVPFFLSLDNQYFNPQQNDRISATFLDVFREWDPAFTDLKKSGYLPSGEKEVVHLEIF